MTYIGAFEITVAVTMSRKISRASSTVSDLLTRTETTNKTTLDSMKDVTKNIVAPFSQDGYSLKITGIAIDSSGKATVAWQASPGATSYAVYRLDPGAEQARLVGSLRGTSFVDSSAGAGGARYCVSGLDRSWNEGRISPVSSA